MKDIMLETDRIIMKSPVGVINANDVLDAVNNKETLEFFSSTPIIYTKEMATSFLDFLKTVEDSKNMLELGIFDKQENLFIGIMALENINYTDNSCELGYFLSKNFTGKGIAYESAKKIINFAFESLKINIIKSYTIKKHKKSVSLLERLGFKQKQILSDFKDFEDVSGEWHLYILEK